MLSMEQASQAINPPKKLRANVVINLIRTLTMTVLSFLTFPYITRALGDNVFGLYTWGNTFVYYFLVLARISIPNIAIRECAKVKNDKVALSHKAQEFFILQAIMTLFSFGLMTSLILTIPSLKENNALIFLLSINFLTGVFSFEWIYITLEKHFYMTVRSILTIAISAAMTFIFVHPTSYPINEIYVYAAINISLTIMTVIINLIRLPKYISLKKTSSYDFKQYGRTLLTLFFISFFLTVYNQTDSFLLGYFDPSKAAVGAYSVGVKGIDIIIGLTTSLYMVFMPSANFYWSRPNKIPYGNLLRYSFNVTLFITLPAIATMATMATPITALISGSSDTASGQYNDANIVLMILASMMLTYSICDTIYTQILLPQKKEKHYSIALLLGVTLNIVGSLIMGLLVFKDRPVIGVAIATAATDLIVLIYLTIVTWQYTSKAAFTLNTLKLVIAATLVGIFCLFFCPFLSDTFLLNGLAAWQAYLFALLICVAIGAIIYLVSLLIMKEHLIFMVLHKSKEANNEQQES